MQQYAQNTNFPKRVQPQYSVSYQLNRSADPHPIQGERHSGHVYLSPQYKPQIFNLVTHHNASEQLQETQTNVQEFLHQNNLIHIIKQESVALNMNFNKFMKNPSIVPKLQENKPNLLQFIT